MKKPQRPRKPKAPKGPLHARLHTLLHAAWKREEITQASLGKAIGWSQENAGQYLRSKKAGTLDLDQADEALRHIGSSLEEFLAGRQPPAPTRADLIARRLIGQDLLMTVVEALLAVPQRRQSVVLGQIDAGVFVATGRRLIPSDES